MASYFDEHNADEATAPPEIEAMMSDAQRRMLQGASGVYSDLHRVLAMFELNADVLQNPLGGNRVNPPASVSVVNELPTVNVSNESQTCPICADNYVSDGEPTAKKLPCGHMYHSSCILPWLSKTNTCPICRNELPTDDVEFERLKREKQLRQRAERQYSASMYL